MAVGHQCLHEVDLGTKLAKLRAERQLEHELQKHTQTCMYELAVAREPSCCYAASTIGVNRMAQPSLTFEEVQQSVLVEQGAAILSLYCHQKSVEGTSTDEEELAFIAPTASRLKLQ